MSIPSSFIPKTLLAKFHPFFIGHEKCTDRDAKLAKLAVEKAFESRESLDQQSIRTYIFEAKSLTMRAKSSGAIVKTGSWIVKNRRCDMETTDDTHLYRVRKAEKLRKYIEAHGLQDRFAVPKKFLYYRKAEEMFYVVSKKLALSVKVAAPNEEAANYFKQEGKDALARLFLQRCKKSFAALITYKCKKIVCELSAADQTLKDAFEELRKRNNLLRLTGDKKEFEEFIEALAVFSGEQKVEGLGTIAEALQKCECDYQRFGPTEEFQKALNHFQDAFEVAFTSEVGGNAFQSDRARSPNTVSAPLESVVHASSESAEGIGSLKEEDALIKEMDALFNLEEETKSAAISDQTIALLLNEELRPLKSEEAKELAEFSFLGLTDLSFGNIFFTEEDKVAILDTEPTRRVVKKMFFNRWIRDRGALLTQQALAGTATLKLSCSDLAALKAVEQVEKKHVLWGLSKLVGKIALGSLAIYFIPVVAALLPITFAVKPIAIFLLAATSLKVAELACSFAFTCFVWHKSCSGLEGAFAIKKMQEKNRF